MYTYIYIHTYIYIYIYRYIYMYIHILKRATSVARRPPFTCPPPCLEVVDPSPPFASLHIVHYTHTNLNNVQNTQRNICSSYLSSFQNQQFTLTTNRTAAARPPYSGLWSFQSMRAKYNLIYHNVILTKLYQSTYNISQHMIIRCHTMVHYLISCCISYHQA